MTSRKTLSLSYLEVDVGEIVYETVNWIQLAHMMVEWLDFMNA
jgi:hypothetical protein